MTAGAEGGRGPIGHEAGSSASRAAPAGGACSRDPRGSAPPGAPPALVQSSLTLVSHSCYMYMHMHMHMHALHGAPAQLNGRRAKWRSQNAPLRAHGCQEP